MKHLLMPVAALFLCGSAWASDTSSKAVELKPKARSAKPTSAAQPKALNKQQRAAALKKKEKAIETFQKRILLEPYNKMNGYTDEAKIKYVGQITQLIRQLSPVHQKKLELVDIGVGDCHKKGGKSCNLVLYSSDKCHLPSIENKNSCKVRTSVYNFSGQGTMTPMSHWEKLRVDLTGICKYGKLKANDKLACEKLAKLAPVKPTLKDLKSFEKNRALKK